MLHYSPAKKNKHQNDYQTLSEPYLYKEHKPPKSLPSHLSVETRAELDDDIFSMRRHFKRTVKELRRGLYHNGWLQKVAEKDASQEYARLHPQHI